MAKSVYDTLAIRGALDLHAYWYAGHFIRQGVDPYQAHLEKLQPRYPVRYLDGVIAQGEFEAQSTLPHGPAITAPLVLLLAPLAWFSWPTAKITWMIVNIGFALFIPVAVLKYYETHDLRLDTRYRALICLLFYSLLATRVAIGNGQTTIIVLFFMASALLLSDRRPILAGILLGFALSKYTLSIPLFIFLIYKRQYLIATISAIVQLIGLILVGVIGNRPPFLVFKEYIDMTNLHINMMGVHVAAYFQPDSIYRILAPVVLTAIVFGWSCYWIIRYARTIYAQGDRLDMHVFATLCLWALLVVYHRDYDAGIIIFFISIVIYGLVEPGMWRLSRTQRQVIGVLFGLPIIVMLLPGALIARFLPAWSGKFGYVIYAESAAIVCMLMLSLWLLYKVLSVTHSADIRFRILN